jgi:hypothetical protein
MLVIADGLQALGERMDQSFTEVRTELRKINAKLDVLLKDQETNA